METGGWIHFARPSASRERRHKYPYEVLDLFGKRLRTSDFWLKLRGVGRCPESDGVTAPGRQTMAKWILGPYSFAVLLSLWSGQVPELPGYVSYQGGGPGFGVPNPDRRHASSHAPIDERNAARSAHTGSQFFKTRTRFPEPPLDPVEHDQRSQALRVQLRSDRRR